MMQMLDVFILLLFEKLKKGSNNFGGICKEFIVLLKVIKNDVNIFTESKNRLVSSYNLLQRFKLYTFSLILF